jgi:hypothetical protein
MDSPGLPFLIEDEGDEVERKDALESMQNLLELIRENIQSPLRITAYLNCADKLLQVMQKEIWPNGF